MKENIFVYDNYHKFVAATYVWRDSKSIIRYLRLMQTTHDKNERDKYFFFTDNALRLIEEESKRLPHKEAQKIYDMVSKMRETLLAGNVLVTIKLAEDLAERARKLSKKYYRRWSKRK